MAGHSKWANIKHKKARADAKRGKAFSTVTKEIIVAVKMGGGDPKMNPQLRLAITKAKAINLPNENIERNIKKAQSKDQSNFDEVAYEVYGKGGVGIICRGLTDNKNRTASDMRIASNKRGGTIAAPGSVSFNFEKMGIMQIEKKDVDGDKLFEQALESGAVDFSDEPEEVFIVTTNPEDLYKVKDSLEEKGYKINDPSLDMVPKTLIECSDEDKEKNLALIEYIEDLDDLDQVFHNMQL
ncbi:MAG: putative transcriptional regulatory protein [Chlamydiia bacterium]|nr:putative transcriptional regulatory protein [Chlamydiia bacterium]MCH9618392.1 putative transcriptional regulatory protein [Chlamydiia bacterium]MCH9624290.1 putative transcriptional regulatory protein [Chlamydiia bacterium]